MKIITSTLSALATLITLFAPAWASDLEEMIVLSDQYPPYNYQDKNGRHTGFAVELLDQAYRAAGAKLDREKIRMQPWPRSYKQVQREDNIILLSMTRTAEREPLFTWVGPITTTRIGLIAKKSRNIKIDKKEDILNYVIGGNPENIGVQLVEELLGDKANIQITPHPESLVHMLDLERFDLWAYEEYSSSQVFKDFGFNPDDYASVYTLRESEIYYALNLNTDPAVVEALQHAIDEIKARETGLSQN
ncbi:MAG: substrate-binding periplasmic protein [Pseudomonadales bacterium]